MYWGMNWFVPNQAPFDLYFANTLWIRTVGGCFISANYTWTWVLNYGYRIGVDEQVIPMRIEYLVSNCSDWSFYDTAWRRLDLWRNQFRDIRR